MLEEARQSVEEALEAMSAAGVEPRASAEFLAIVARALKDGGADARSMGAAGRARPGARGRCAGPALGEADAAAGPLRVDPERPDRRESLAGTRPGSSGDCPGRGRRRGLRAHAGPARLSHARGDGGRPRPGPLLVAARRDHAGAGGGRPRPVYRHGAFREALAVYEELLAVSERFGSIPSQGEALAQIATSQIATGDLLLSAGDHAAGEGSHRPSRRRHRMHRFVAISRAVHLAYFLDGDWALSGGSHGVRHQRGRPAQLGGHDRRGLRGA